MDFNSLGLSAPIYVLKVVDGKPVYSVGSLKSKINPKTKYTNGQPNLYNASNAVQVFDIVVSFNGKGDEVFTEIPITAVVANTEDKKAFFSTSQTAIAGVLRDLIQSAQKALDQAELDRHKAMIAEGSKIMESIDPRFAEEKRQARSISELQKSQQEWDKRFSKIEATNERLMNDNAKILGILQKLTGDKSVK